MTMTNAAPLFEPMTVRGMTIANRIVMAPMTRSFSPNGVPTDEVRDYYQRRAEADVGLIISEGTTIQRDAASFDPRIPNFHEDDALQGWRKVIDSVHSAQGRMGPQIWHVGMARRQGTGPVPEAASDSPSGLTHKGKAITDAPTDEDVADMVAAYAKAAKEATTPKLRRKEDKKDEDEKQREPSSLGVLRFNREETLFTRIYTLQFIK